MSELPSNWKEVKWNDITGIDGFRRGPFGGNLKKSCFVDEGFAVYEQYAPINNDCNSFRYFITADKFEELSGFQVLGGDFLISCSGTMGKITCVPEQAPKGVINQALLRIRLQDKFIDSDYFLRLFKSPQVQSLVLNKSGGGAIQNLAAVKELKEIPLPIAPLAEQKRIVEKLDEVLAQVDTIKARLDGIPELLKRFRQSVLASAVSGKLTEEWRESHNFFLTIERYKESLGSFKHKAKQLGELSEISNWLEAQLGHVISVKSGDGLTAKKMNPVGHIPVYGGNGITGFHDKGNVGVETIVIGRVGYYCGSVHMTESPAWVTDNALLVDFPYGLLEKNFVYWLLTATNLRVDDSSSAQPVISGAKIYPIKVKIPPLEEQKEIVRLVEQYFAFADTIEAQVKKAQARVNNLTQSILAKAFRGELVPQDPNDEPADKLLERIALARKEAEALAKAAKKAQSTKSTAKKKVAKSA